MSCSHDIEPCHQESKEAINVIDFNVRIWIFVSVLNAVFCNIELVSELFFAQSES